MRAMRQKNQVELNLSPGAEGEARSAGAWQIVERLSFQNLPVAIRQGELFM